MVVRRARASTERPSFAGFLQTKTSGSAPAAVSPHTAARIGALRGGGRPLPPAVRGYFEPRFGRDLGAVRVHTGGEAAAAARDVQARAFTVGADIAFAAGEWRPEASAGRRLLAHELVHTMQQAATSTAGPPGARLQRQPARKGKPLDKRHIPGLRSFFDRRADADTLAIADRLDFTGGKAREVWKAEVDGTRHVWKVALTWNPASASSTSPETVKPASGVTEHTIEIVVGYRHANRQLAADSPAMKIGDPIQAGLYLTAEALYHELVHVQLAIGSSLEQLSPGGGLGPSVFDRYASQLAIAQGAGFATRRQAIERGLTGLLLMARTLLNLPARADQEAAWLAGSYEFFVQERFAFQRTGKRFGAPPTNRKIADEYVVHRVEALIPGDPAVASIYYRRLSADPRWTSRESALQAEVAGLFDDMDRDLAIQGYMMPGLLPSPSPPPAPITIGGDPA